ncbi:MAG TPA: HAMP domain-containing sensor histidine kinase [Acidimicrobiales bacterium]
MRITATAVVVTAAAVGAAGWLLVRSVEDTQLGQLRDDVNARLDEVGARLEAGADPTEAVQGPPSAPVVTVHDADGRLVAASAGATFRQEGPPPSDGAPDGGSSASGSEQGEQPAGEPPGEAHVAGAMATDDGEMVVGEFETLSRTVETPSGPLTVSAGAPVEQVARSLDALRDALVAGLPAVVVVVAVVAWLLVGRALRPVEAIRAEVDEITATTMHRRVPEPATADEIGRLARTMNAMLARLDRATTRQRQFVSDASHELRSPVAAIRTALEVARRQRDPDWPAVADAALTEETRLEALLDDLLLLAAHDEHAGRRPAGPPVDLAAIAAAEAERPRRVPVEVAAGPANGGGPAHGAGPLLVPGPADGLTRVVSNLLDNAARHAHSAVRVGVEADVEAGCPGPAVRLTVDDDGPGIPPADRDRVFERFTRLDHARARGDGDDGSGLGLAVVRAIVTAHGGAVRVEDAPLGGARFVVTLPAAPPR